jgi:hypothetical protein
MGDMIAFADFNALVGLPAVRGIEASYLPPKQK